jgi:hypothetical protein
MDFGSLATGAVALLVPYLASAGKSVAEGIFKDLGQALHAKLGTLYQAVKERFAGDEDAGQSLHRLSEKPEDTGRQEALRRALAKVLDEDSGFRNELARIVAEARRSGGDEIIRIYGNENIAQRDIINVTINGPVISESAPLLDTQRFMTFKGVAPFRDWLGEPEQPWDTSFLGREHISSLRRKLLRIRHLDRPRLVTVQGTIYPCALLSPAWWERRDEGEHTTEPDWEDGLQKWLFYGFDLWGPSWDFSWDFDAPTRSAERPFFIAQLGDGDEANSLPVIIPLEKARKLRDKLLGGWGGLEVRVLGLLGHRHQFPKRGPARLELVGGLLDYCIWLDETNGDHMISPLANKTSIYSGYLWKCVAPRKWAETSPSLCINQVYFVWEHTNFAEPDAVRYNLDSLAQKEDFLRRRHGDLILLQKSSALVPGTPAWSSERFYDLLTCKACEDI